MVFFKLKCVLKRSTFVIANTYTIGCDSKIIISAAKSLFLLIFSHLAYRVNTEINWSYTAGVLLMKKLIVIALPVVIILMLFVSNLNGTTFGEVIESLENKNGKITLLSISRGFQDDELKSIVIRDPSRINQNTKRYIRDDIERKRALADD
jgi:hypothetical protein